MLGESNLLAKWKEIFGAGTEPVDDADKYPAFDEVLSKCQEVHQANVALLDSMSEEDLDTPPAKPAHRNTKDSLERIVSASK